MKEIKVKHDAPIVLYIGANLHIISIPQKLNTFFVCMVYIYTAKCKQQDSITFRKLYYSPFSNSPSRHSLYK